MCRSSALFCFLLFFSLSTCVLVRITDRKPKWVVLKEQEEKARIPAEESRDTTPSSSNDETEIASPSEQPPSPPVIDYDSIPRRRGVFGRSGPSALSSLESVCADFHEGNYDFHICPFQYIAQVENWEGGYRGIIGIWGHFDGSLNQKEVRMVLDDGDWCSNSLARQSTIMVQCDETAQSPFVVTALSEVETCRYEIKAVSPLVCEIDPSEEVQNPTERPVMTGDEGNVGEMQHGMGGYDDEGLGYGQEGEMESEYEMNYDFGHGQEDLNKMSRDEIDRRIMELRRELTELEHMAAHM